jgi:hypothetical protein
LYLLILIWIFQICQKHLITIKYNTYNTSTAYQDIHLTTKVPHVGFIGTIQNDIFKALFILIKNILVTYMLHPEHIKNNMFNFLQNVACIFSVNYPGWWAAHIHSVQQSPFVSLTTEKTLDCGVCSHSVIQGRTCRIIIQTNADSNLRK